MQLHVEVLLEERCEHLVIIVDNLGVKADTGACRSQVPRRLIIVLCCFIKAILVPSLAI